MRSRCRPSASRLATHKSLRCSVFRARESTAFKCPRHRCWPRAPRVTELQDERRTAVGALHPKPSRPLPAILGRSTRGCVGPAMGQFHHSQRRRGTTAICALHSCHCRPIVELRESTLRDIPGHKITPSPPNGRPIVSAPNCAQSSMLRPMSASDRRARARAKRIHRRDQPKKTEHLPLSLKETDLKDPIKRAYVVPIEPRVLPDSSSARQLSDGSPLSAMKSGTWFGSTPSRCRTSSGPTCAILLPRGG